MISRLRRENYYIFCKISPRVFPPSLQNQLKSYKARFVSVVKRSFWTSFFMPKRRWQYTVTPWPDIATAADSCCAAQLCVVVRDTVWYNGKMKKQGRPSRRYHGVRKWAQDKTPLSVRGKVLWCIRSAPGCLGFQEKQHRVPLRQGKRIAALFGCQ